MSDAKSRRLGRFFASGNLITDDIHALRAVMGTCVVIRCEHIFAVNMFEYTALSPLFDVLNEGDVIPVYRMVMTSDGPLDQRIIYAERLGVDSTPKMSWLH
jgi:hypothetical protein